MRDFWETTPVATQQRAVHQHARRRDSTQSAALHPLRSAAPITKHCTHYEALHPLRSIAPIKERCTRSERVQCLPMGYTAPSATSTNAESPTKVQPDREHSPRSEGVKPYRPQPITTSSSADRRAFLASTPRPFRARVPGENTAPERARPGRGTDYRQVSRELHPKVARNLPWSVFDWRHKRCNCNDRISKPERLIGKLRATLWGNYASTRTVNGPSLTSDTSIIAPNWPVSTCRPRPRRSATTASTRGSASSPGAA